MLDTILVVAGGVLLGGAIIGGTVGDIIEQAKQKQAEMEYYNPNKGTRKPKTQIVKSYVRTLSA